MSQSHCANYMVWIRFMSSQAMTILTVIDEQHGDPQEQRKGAFINLNLNC